MSTNRKKDEPVAEFPALRSFLRGYFHQDMKDEYASAEEALREFCADASRDELLSLAKDWFRFLEQYKSQPIQILNETLTGPLGSYYSLTSEQVEHITAILKEVTNANK